MAINTREYLSHCWGPKALLVPTFGKYSWVQTEQGENRIGHFPPLASCQMLTTRAISHLGQVQGSARAASLTVHLFVCLFFKPAKLFYSNEPFQGILLQKHRFS